VDHGAYSGSPDKELKLEQDACENFKDGSSRMDAVD
jgi:hypothetical protein